MMNFFRKFATMFTELNFFLDFKYVNEFKKMFTIFRNCSGFYEKCSSNLKGA